MVALAFGHNGGRGVMRRHSRLAVVFGLAFALPAAAQVCSRPAAEPDGALYSGGEWDFEGGMYFTGHCLAGQHAAPPDGGHESAVPPDKWANVGAGWTHWATFPTWKTGGYWGVASFNENKNCANVYRGSRSQEITLTCANGVGGVYRQAAVPPRHRIRVEAWMKFTPNGDARDVEHALGIDPLGGTDPASPRIQWTLWPNAVASPPQPPGEFNRGVVEAVSLGRTITVFIRQRAFEPVCQGQTFIFDSVRVFDLGPDDAASTTTPAPATAASTPAGAAPPKSELRNDTPKQTPKDAPPPAVQWRLAFEDAFEREAVGGSYSVITGEARVERGRLYVVGDDAMTWINVPVPRDCRVECDVTTAPGTALGAMGCLFRSDAGADYRFDLGAQGGGVHRVTGPRLTLVNDASALRLEPGKSYHLSAQRDGRRYTLAVNDTVLVDGEVDKVVGHVGIQRVAFVAEHGMTVDDVKVYGRVPSHPDCCPPPLPWLPLTRRGSTVVPSAETHATPALEAALAALNAERFDEAKKRFAAMDDPVLRLTGLAFVLGHLDYYERPVYGDLVNGKEKSEYTDAEVDLCFGEFGRFAAAWREAAEQHPDNELLRDYWPYVEHFGRMTLNRWLSPAHAKALLELDDRVNPFHPKARLYDARFTYWNGMEGGNPALREKALATMRSLKAAYPDSRVLREYVGPPVPWGENLVADTDKHPAWAAYLREAYAREIAVIERLMATRERPDGQFGGGYGDDVEMLRLIGPLAAISSCSTTVADGIQRLAEGVWKHKCIDGYNPEFGDVEHTAEESGDAFPTMMYLRYGDPRYVEFNLRSAKTIHDKFMGIDQKGFPRFYSCMFGTSRVGPIGQSGGDTGYHARAMKHFLWLAWYGNRDARDWYLRWVDGWRDACMIDAPDKPAGVLPGTLWYPSGTWQHPWGGPWYVDSGMQPYGALGMQALLHQSFLDAYALSGDEKFLRPVQRMMDWATMGPLQPGPDHARVEPGTREWFRLPMAHVTNASHTSLYRALTGERVYDEYTKRFGTATQKYQIDHDLDAYMTGIEAAAKSLRTNLWYYTTETLSTDRLGLPAVADVWGAYTGAITRTTDADFPTFAVTYDTPTTDFAALVVENTPRRLRVWLYSFWDEPTPITLHVWQLRPGEYILNQGELLPGEFAFQHRYGWQAPARVRVAHRAEPVPVTLPPGKVWVVDLRFDEPIDVPTSAPDLAAASRDIAVQGQVMTLTVHNVGNAPADNVVVELQRWRGDRWDAVGRRTIQRVSEPVDYVPYPASVAFDVPRLDLTTRYRFVIDPDDALYELCETNNAAELDGTPRKTPSFANVLPESQPPPAIPPTSEIDLGGELTIELVLVPAGEFMMGLPDDEPRAAAYDRPPHRVRFDRPFYMSKYEITQAQWQRVTDRNPSHFTGDERRPVDSISWDMANEFCERLSRRVWRRVRLPSEAEWEYACRAGAASYWSCGDSASELADCAWYGANADGTTHPVGAKRPNAFDLYDMHGNVSEWCADVFGPYAGVPDGGQGGADVRRVNRGGAFDTVDAESLGSARRGPAKPHDRRERCGIRIVVPIGSDP